MTLRIIEKPKAARMSKSDVESLHGVRVSVCLMVVLRKDTELADSSLLLVAFLRLHPPGAVKRPGKMRRMREC